MYLVKKKKKKKKKKKIRNNPSYNYTSTYQNYVKEDFQRDVINDHHWLEYYNSDDVNIKCKLFEDMITMYADIHCPIKEIRV